MDDDQPLAWWEQVQIELLRDFVTQQGGDNAEALAHLERLRADPAAWRAYRAKIREKLVARFG